MSQQPRIITKQELKEHDENHKDPWLLIHGKVYTVKDYQFEHPGGSDILLEHAGGDASESFDNVGHSKDARNKLIPLLVGEIEGYQEKSSGSSSKVEEEKPSNSSPLSSLKYLVIAVLALGGAYFYTKFNV
ncbi:hypothetical protein ABK040_010235 [Willaertia magna]